MSGTLCPCFTVTYLFYFGILFRTNSMRIGTQLQTLKIPIMRPHGSVDSTWQSFLSSCVIGHDESLSLSLFGFGLQAWKQSLHLFVQESALLLRVFQHLKHSLILTILSQVTTEIKVSQNKWTACIYCLCVNNTPWLNSRLGCYEQHEDNKSMKWKMCIHSNITQHVSRCCWMKLYLPRWPHFPLCFWRVVARSAVVSALLLGWDSRCYHSWWTFPASHTFTFDLPKLDFKTFAFIILINILSVGSKRTETASSSGPGSITSSHVLYK